MNYRTRKIKYRAYLLTYLFLGIENAIDRRPLSFEAFNKRYIEKGKLP